MPESFLILLSGGVMLAAAVSNPRQVTVGWLRLGGILALCFAGLAGFFLVRRYGVDQRWTWGLLVGVIILVLGQLGSIQVMLLRIGRMFAVAGFVGAVLLGTMLPGDTDLQDRIAKPTAILMQTVGCAGVAALCGLVLMDMLLGHAYLTASRMTIAPFRRLNVTLAVILIARVLVSAGAILWQSLHPIELFWGRFGLLLGTRWLVGLVVPALLVYMVHDCIRRRSTQSATGILYVTGVLIFIGELIALHLTRESGLPL